MNIINRCKRALLLAAAAVAAVCLSGCGVEGEPDDAAYEYVSIGGKKWMKRNLDVETDNSWCYDNDPDNCARYGRLYDWSAAKKACPSGWKLPDTADWGRLAADAGGWEDAGGKLKSSSDWDGTDAYGFAAMPGGNRSPSGRFSRVGEESIWWTATKRDDASAYYRSIGSGYDDIQGIDQKTGFGFSVRCVR